MARQDTASEPPGHARLMVTIMMVFVVNATLYYVLPSLMADVGYLLLTSVLGLSLDGKYFEDPRYFAAAAYLGFLVLPSCGALFSAGATLLLTLRRLVHLFLKILGRPRPFDIEKPKVFGSVLFLAAVLTYYTIGFPHLVGSGNPRVTGMPLGFHAFATTVIAMLVVVFALASLLDPKHVNRNFKL